MVSMAAHRFSILVCRLNLSITKAVFLTLVLNPLEVVVHIVSTLLSAVVT